MATEKSWDDQLKELAAVDTQTFGRIVDMYLNDLNKRIEELKSNNITVVSLDEWIETIDIFQMFLVAELEHVAKLLSGLEKDVTE